MVVYVGSSNVVQSHATCSLDVKVMNLLICFMLVSDGEGALYLNSGNCIAHKDDDDG